MKTLTFSLALFVLLNQAYSQETTSNRDMVGFYFIESSSGLNNPEWDTGDTEIEFADMNQDGYVDIISIGDHGSPYINTNEHGIMVWFGDGAGTWSVEMNGNFGYGGIAVGDANRDGLWDVGYGMHHNYSSTDFGDQLMEVALGNGTGVSWTPWDDGLATNGEDYGMFATDFADINNDGYLDMGSLSFGSGNGLHIYLNNGDGTWTQSYQYGGPTSNSNDEIHFGDINKDGYSDCAATQQGAYVFFGDGNGNFTTALFNMPSFSSPPSDIALGDVDGDGGKDLALSNYNGEIKVWVFDEVNLQWMDYSGSLPTVSDYYFVELFDLDNDGNIDLLASGKGQLGIWSGDGEGNWNLENTMLTASGNAYTSAFRVGGDVDNNGFADIALVQETGSWPSTQNHLKCFKETSSFFLPAIKVVFPRGGEVFYQNSDQFIDCLCAIDTISIIEFEIYYSLMGENGPWVMLTSSTANLDRYQWTIPQTISSNNCFLMYSMKTNAGSIEAITPNAFTILGEDGIEADFIADSLFVQPQSDIQFTDQSLGLLTSWAWDFDNDGTVDATDRNPVYSYSLPGTYTVKLSVSDGQNSDTEIKVDYITVVENTGINNVTSKQPELRIYPNPFYNNTQITYYLKNSGRTELIICNMSGQKIRTLTNTNQSAGEHSFIWDGTDDSGKQLNSGIYLCILSVNGYFYPVKKSLLLR
jgi:PKD repeat protein